MIMLKANNELLPDNLHKFFNVKYTMLHVTHQSNKLKHVYARTTLKAKCTYVYGVKLWNSLDESIRSSVTIQNLKKNYIKCISLKSINYLNKLLCGIKQLEIYMCKWVSVICYLLTIYYKFMFIINMYMLL